MAYEGSSTGMMNIDRIDEIDLNEDAVKKFKETIMNMHRGIPLWHHYGFLEKLIPNKEIRDYFLDKDIFIKLKQKEFNQEKYFLGINGIMLANNYRVEDLTEEMNESTRQIKLLTIAVSILAGLTFFATIINIFF